MGIESHSESHGTILSSRCLWRLCLIYFALFFHLRRLVVWLHLQRICIDDDDDGGGGDRICTLLSYHTMGRGSFGIVL